MVMPAQRIIKKYPNRRLYDTEISRYITLEDIKNLVLDGVDFCVLNVKTDEDSTRNILMQIIAEQEHGSDAIFSVQSLTRIINCYGQTHQALLADYLQGSLELFSHQLKGFQQRIGKDAKNELTEQDIQLWKKMQESFFASASMAAHDPEPES